MDATLEKLERLAALHRAGSLSDAEFEDQKARLLVEPQAASAPHVVAPSTSEAELSPKWQRRFTFFRAHGSPFLPAGAAALQKLPFWTASSIRMNMWAFFFGPIYFFKLGLWKRALSMTAVIVVINWVLISLLGEGWAQPLGAAYAVTFSMTANYCHFIKVTQGRDEWNPLKDIFVSRHEAAIDLLNGRERL